MTGDKHVLRLPARSRISARSTVLANLCFCDQVFVAGDNWILSKMRKLDLAIKIHCWRGGQINSQLYFSYGLCFA